MTLNLTLSKRTKILAATAAALALVCMAEFLLGLRSPEKNFGAKGEADYISIENAGQTTILQKNGDGWFCGQDILDEGKVESLKNTALPLKTLGVTSRSSSAASLERYGLDKPIAVRIMAKNKTLVSFLLGKDSASGAQSYVQIDGKKEIYLARGSLRALWSAGIDSLKAAPKAPANDDESAGD